MIYLRCQNQRSLQRKLSSSFRPSRALKRPLRSGILAVATPLIRAGYEIVLIDSTITPDYKKRVLEEVRDAVCLGISLVTGPMIRETVKSQEPSRNGDPDFPIILGGWHPSLFPIRRLQAAYVDYVVRGQGEDALLEFVRHIENGSAPDFVAGIGFKRDGKLIMTPERPLQPAGRHATQGLSHRRLRRV